MSKYENALNHYRAMEKSLEQEPVNKELLDHTRVAIKAIGKRIPKAALDKVERLTETVGAKELKGSHKEGCYDCLCYTCVYDDGGSLGDDLPWCCDRHGVECPITSCKDYRREL